ncbi:MAG: thiamine-phosphate kinase [Planctomycetales bacterium]|nr:thiamine-phosphate kinase [Planctomycetales bacterium]
MERDFLRRLLPRLPGHPRLLLGPGDDAALLALAKDNACVVTTDMLMDGVDFELGQCDVKRIGRKSLAVNLSDLAAMAARPVGVVISLALPRKGGEELAFQFYKGLLPLAVEFETAIAGGDTNSWDGPLVISITAIGEVIPGKEWRRSGARPGDEILVTGSFGGSILGKHFDFTPRVREALLLAEQYDIDAAMDVSDGLSLDLSRMCEASGCGAVLDLKQVPIAPAAFELASQKQDGLTPPDHALADGEDFELILAAAPEVAAKLLATQPLGVPLTSIGKFVKESGMWQETTEGTRQPLAPRGYEHQL